MSELQLWFFLVHTNHNSNVIISWNILHASAELGITRVTQASSINVIPLIYSQQYRFKYYMVTKTGEKNHVNMYWNIFFIANEFMLSSIASSSNSLSPSAPWLG